jgi:HD superfamily phosphohydrolase
MGLSYLVYPGANHTRFHHALGCMHLMQKAVVVLRFKVAISVEEENAPLYCYCTILGHGPFRMLWKKVLLKMYITRKSPLLFMHH